jgi:FixJ family two-component response regulator
MGMITDCRNEPGKEIADRLGTCRGLGRDRMRGAGRRLPSTGIGILSVRGTLYVCIGTAAASLPRSRPKAYVRTWSGRPSAHSASELTGKAMKEPSSTIIVIDDDPEVRDSLDSLLRSMGFQVKLLGSVSEFLALDQPEEPTCLVLDIRLPGQSGLDFQRDLSAARRQLPIIFITGHGDIPMSVRAMKGGAIEFLTKPFRDQDLLDAIQLGLTKDRAWIENEKSLASLRSRFETLTQREREIMAKVVTGRLNKQIAADLGISEITVKVHRGQVMRKMHASSLPELTKMADKLHLANDTQL